MNYKVLVVDIDDTLMTSENKISPKTREAIMAMQEAGYIFVLASGRPYQSVYRIAKDLELDRFGSYIISFNGGRVTEVASEGIIYAQPMDEKEQLDVIDFILANDLTPLTYTDEEIKVHHKNDYSHVESELTGLPYSYDPDFFVNVQAALPKIMGVGDPDIVGRLEAESQGRFSDFTHVTTSKPFYLELMHKDVSKGTSLKRLAEHLELSLEQIIAVGDGNNDKEMLQTAGIGVAMGNANESLKAIADEVTASNDEDGIVPIIEKYFAI
ncbi:HAD family hydrolase [Suicoccus acidiformans]|uniref:HAD family hydrolase n=1 Tax=Suicoccus acidiformans TaxID=2036206 RepID=A0A347WK27_9LACT|nr:Cof-type HAD-IIB family hydrolase [Suicoccus acidiformans]AXY25434.1 HAD family hydrolase [Suicoccus acidiformans]